MKSAWRRRAGKLRGRISGVSAVSAGRVISFKTVSTLLSERTLRNGDWPNAKLNACSSVSSKMASPVLLLKSRNYTDSPSAASVPDEGIGSALRQWQLGCGRVRELSE